jgi:ribosome biogenesis SPOUT family RNA methylase Rps3
MTTISTRKSRYGHRAVIEDISLEHNAVVRLDWDSPHRLTPEDALKDGIEYIKNAVPGAIFRQYPKRYRGKIVDPGFIAVTMPA